VPTLKKSDDSGESQTTFEISGRILVELAGNVKSCLSFCKGGRKLKKPAGNSESCLEIQKVSWKFQFPSDFLKSRLTFLNAV
jgi:hypothetical protein